MIDDLYNSKILSAAARISHVGRLEQPDATANQRSPLCGSSITVDIKVTDGVVTAFAQEVRACVLGQAAASLVAKRIIGSTAEELKALRLDILGMLKEGGKPPRGRFAELAILGPIRDFPARHGSTLLIFDAVVACLEQCEKKAFPHEADTQL